MKITLSKIIEGAFKVTFDDFDVNVLDEYYDYQSLIDLIAADVATSLDLTIGEVTKWEGLADGTTIDRDEYKADPYTWHTDGSTKIDTVMLIYFPIPNIDETTGGRLVIRDLRDPDNEVWCDLQHGTAILLCQSDKRFEHRVEKTISGRVENRRVIDFGMRGWNTSAVLASL